jgi:Tfp pilus assembly protein PilF
MKKLLPLLFFALILAGCSSSEKTETTATQGAASDVKSQESKIQYEYGGSCAAAMKANKTGIKGDPAYSLEHNDRHFCFSSEKARDSFKKNIDKNIADADRNWSKARVNNRAY